MGGRGGGVGATKRRGDERAFLQEEEIYSVGLVQIEQRRGEHQDCFLLLLPP